MTEPLYAITDIHGQRDMLETALARIERDGGTDSPLVFLGDYVDRGPDSRGVIDIVMGGQEAGRDWTALRGNHDQMFLDFLDRACSGATPAGRDRAWLGDNLGGRETLASYGIDAPPENVVEAARAAAEAVPAAHRDWLADLPYHHLGDGMLFVHAGIAPRVALERQKPEDMLWIRDRFLDHRRAHPWLVVHGHTAISHPRHYGNRVNLDGGAGWDRPLYPAVFEGRECWLLTENGRERLSPGR